MIPGAAFTSLLAEGLGVARLLSRLRSLLGLCRHHRSRLSVDLSADLCLVTQHYPRSHGRLRSRQRRLESIQRLGLQRW